jgi:hypothetical protein
LARVLRTIGLLFGFVALAALPAVGLGAYAAADSGPSPATNATPGATAPHSRSPLSDEQRHPRPGFRRGPGARPPLTDEQRQCLADHGVPLPPRPADGQRRQPPSQADRDALRAAAEACGLPHRVPHGEQRVI